jgi:hypothetical protein
MRAEAETQERRGGKRIEDIASIYMSIKSFVIDAGYVGEVDWQEDVSLDNVDEKVFLQQAGWVVLSSGMRESVIKQKFPGISKAFLEWESAELIVRNRERCFVDAIQCFGHKKKISAIIDIAEDVAEKGFVHVCDNIASEGVDYIMGWPYMGPATSYHFAKNLGLPVAKPDRHLVRIAKKVGYDSPQ